MRGPEDRVLVQVTMSTVADLDMERLEEDPIWEMVSYGAPDRETAILKYLREYLRNHLLLTNVPCTNGPSSIYVEKVEVTDAGRNESTV